MQQNFAECVRRVLIHEGDKFTNDPRDNGGATRYGITLNTWREHGHPNAPVTDIQNMTVTAAAQFYRTVFWNKLNLDQMPWGVDYALFDYALHSGIGRAPRVLQRLIGVGVDGNIGPATITAAVSRDPKVLAAAICDERLRYLRTLEDWPAYKNGWTRRVGEVQAAAVSMAGHSQGVTPDVSASAVIAGLPWVQRLDAILGLYEFPGGADNPAVLAMAAACGGNIARTYKHDSTAWCALTMNYELKASGLPGNDSLWALDFRKYGTKLDGPAYGAIATKTRDGGGHVFTVIGRTVGGLIVGRGGNQSDMVCDEIFDPGVCQYNWPPGVPLPKTGIANLPITSPRPKVHKSITLPPATAFPVAVQASPVRATPAKIDPNKIGAPVAVASDGAAAWGWQDWLMANMVEAAFLLIGGAVFLVVIVHWLVGRYHKSQAEGATAGVTPVAI